MTLKLPDVSYSKRSHTKALSYTMTLMTLFFLNLHIFFYYVYWTLLLFFSKLYSILVSLVS